MSRPKKPSPYDALMIRQLRDGGLLCINPLQRPVNKRWFNWHGIEASGCYSETTWRDWPPPQKPEPEKRPGARLKSERPLLSSPWDTWNMRKREVDAAHRRDNWTLGKIAIAVRLQEYKDAGILSQMLLPHPYERQLWRIWKEYKNTAAPYFELGKSQLEKLEKAGLPKK